MAREGGERRWRPCSMRLRRSAHSSRPMHVYWLADVASAACARQATCDDMALLPALAGAPGKHVVGLPT